MLSALVARLSAATRGLLRIAPVPPRPGRRAFALLLCVTLPHAAAAATYTVGTRLDLNAGSAPAGIAAADLNGDGTLDLAVTNYGAGTVAVYLGNGNGAFSGRVGYTAGTNPYFVAIGDVNGDGKPDLVVSNFGSNNVSVLYGTGGGGFGAKTDLTAGSQPSGIALADLDGDGHPDIVVANHGAGTVSVFMGHGTGFDSQVTYTVGVGTGPIGLAIGDVNGDGIPDIVVANTNGTTMSVLIGNGDGTFAAKVDYTCCAYPFAVAVGDLNGDGCADVVVVGGSPGRASVLLGSRSSGLGTHTDFTIGPGPFGVAIADMDGDGKPDVVTTNGGSNVSLLLGDGAGSLGAKTDFATGSAPYGLAVADLNRDGVPDLVTANSGGPNVSVLLGSTGAGFATAVDYTVGAGPFAMAVADMNGDGISDLVVPNTHANTLSVLLGNGDGTYGTRNDFPTGGSAPLVVATGDVNADGKRDVVTLGTAGDALLMLGNGAGGLEAATDLGFGFARDMAGAVLTDLDHDGHLDIVVSTSDPDHLIIARGNGDGTFQTPTSYNFTGEPQGVAVGDLNGDGVPDIVTANLDSTVSIGLWNHTNDYGTWAKYSVGRGASFVAIADLNGDGAPDLVVTDFLAAAVTVLYGVGDGTFSGRTDFAVGSGPGGLAVTDVNGDGRLDIVTANEGGTMTILLGNGAGSFGAPISIAGGNTPAGVVVADLNGDGRPDIVRANYGGNTVSVLLALERTSVTLAASPSPALIYTPLLLSATVAAIAPGTGTPTGKVRFFDGTTLLGTANVEGGIAGLALAAPYLGARNLSAVYLGDSKYEGSISLPCAATVVSTAAPRITSIKDVRADHGRAVQIDFAASGFDFFGSATPITGYAVYRQASAMPPSSARPATSASVKDTARPANTERAGWDYLLTVPATCDGPYQIVAPTLTDSSSTGTNAEMFSVRALTATPGVYYDGAGVSGYSVDDIAPALPVPFTADWARGTTYLHWGANTESDFAYFRLYRGTSAGFVPGAGNVITTTSDTGYVDAGATGKYYYKLSAANLSGIESGYAVVTPSGTAGVDDAGIPGALFLAAPNPNPARTGTTLRFGLPRDATVSLRIYGVDGRLVRELAGGMFAAGEHALAWDLRDGSGGAVGAGVYFARLTVEGVTRAVRFAVAR